MEIVERIILAFVIMSAVSILGLVLMFIIKDKKVNAVLFYMMSIWGMVLAGISAYLLPIEDLTMQLLVWIFGMLGMIAMLIKLCGKQEKGELISRLLVVFSVVLGILGIFIF